MSDNHSNFTMIPHLIDDLGLDVYQFRVYCAIKRAAGSQGNCMKSYPNLAKQCGISERKLIQTVNELCEINQIVHKSLISRQRRKKENGDSDTCILIVNDVWNENKSKIKEKFGGAPYAPPGAQDAPPLVHGMHHPGAPYAPKEYTIKKIPLKKTTTTPTPSNVHKSSSSSIAKANKEAAQSLHDWLHTQAYSQRKRKLVGKREQIDVQWGDNWVLSVSFLSELMNKYDCDYVQQHFNEMIRQQSEFDAGRGKEILSPEKWLRMACEKNWVQIQKKE